MLQHSQKIKVLTSLANSRENKFMQIQGQNPSSSAAQPATALGVDTSCIIQKVTSIKDARALAAGSMVGDLHGGLTFTDAVAAALEARSSGGWQEMRTRDGQIWTVIVLDR